MALLTLGSIGDLARICDVDRSTVYYWSSRPGFPEPIGTVGNARVWNVEEVVAWKISNIRARRKPDAGDGTDT